MDRGSGEAATPNSSDLNDRPRKPHPDPSAIYSVRMPVRWDGRTHNNRTDILNFETPTPIERVTQWVETDGFDEEIIYNSTLVRRDFSKFVSTTPTSSSNSSSNTEMVALNRLSEESDLPETEQETFLPAFYSRLNENGTDAAGFGSENGVPARRPEIGSESISQKKFCYYLKLMEPLEKKETDFVKQRRSTRVRNLTLQQKKKKNGEDSEKAAQVAEASNEEIAMIDLTESADEAESNNSDVLTLKSCKDLNMKINRAEQDSIVGTRNERFRFPTPPSQAFLEEDFDDSIKRLISKYKQKSKNKPKVSKNRRNGQISRTSNFRKTNTRNCKFKPTLKRPQKSITKPKDKHSRNKTKDKLKKKPFKLVPPVAPVTVPAPTPAPAPAPAPVKNNNNKLKNSKSVVNKNKKNKSKVNNNNNKSKLKAVTVLLEKRVPVVTRSLGKSEEETEIDKINEEQKVTEEQEEIIMNQSPSPLRITNTDTTANEFCALELDNFDFNMLFSDIAEDMETLSEEHRRCLIESQILSSRCHLSKPRPTSIASDSTINNNESLKIKTKTGSTNTQETEESPNSGQDSSNAVEFLSLKVDYTTGPQSTVLKTEPISSDEDQSDCKKTSETCQRSKTRDTDTGERGSSPVIISDISEASDPSHLDYSYSSSSSRSNMSDDDDDSRSRSRSSPRGFPSPVLEEIDTNDIERNNRPVVRVLNPPEFKSLHKSLTTRKRKPPAAPLNNLEETNSDDSTWESDDDDDRRQVVKRSKTSHSVTIAKEDGRMTHAFYVDYNLVVCQEARVSFWTQSALGNILGSQEMWVPKGRLQKLVLNDNSVRKTSSEMVISMENSLAYVELWTKEHKSDIREGPVADVFAIVYFWKQGNAAPDKKALQLENIKGFGEDVQYVVLKSSPKIIVSWHSVMENDKSTYVRVYNLAADYQTVQDVLEFDPIKHYVASLHNIQECESTLMGCGENKISIWNVEHGYIVATIEMNDIKLPLRTLWVKCDRGFLFMLQQCMDGELRLIAINALNQSWKKLQSYNPISGFDSFQLKGACIEHGVLISYYDQGIICWKAESGEPLVEELPNGAAYIPSGSHIIMETDGRVIVSSALTHLMCTDEGTGESG